MNNQIKLLIGNGKITGIYSDALIPLIESGKSNVRRVSHVEPSNSSQTFGMEWTATMLDYNTVLGPFPSRAQALDAEIKFLEERLFSCPK
jgi:hypothetical protein